MKDYLIREQKRLEAKKAKRLKRSQESENIDEVRSTVWEASSDN